jgi:hypothetical protein
MIKDIKNSILVFNHIPAILVIDILGNVYNALLAKSGGGVFFL